MNGYYRTEGSESCSTTDCCCESSSASAGVGADIGALAEASVLDDGRAAAAAAAAALSAAVRSATVLHYEAVEDVATPTQFFAIAGEDGESTDVRDHAEHFSIADVAGAAAVPAQHLRGGRLGPAGPRIECMAWKESVSTSSVCSPASRSSTPAKPMLGLPVGSGPARFGSLTSGGSNVSSNLRATTPPARRSPPPPILGSLCSTPSAQATASGGSGSAAAAPQANPVLRLSQENEALRGALGQAMKRLSELEGEQERFLAEGVFDLVNSLCGSPDAHRSTASPLARHPTPMSRSLMEHDLGGSKGAARPLAEAGVEADTRAEADFGAVWSPFHLTGSPARIRAADDDDDVKDF